MGEAKPSHQPLGSCADPAPRLGCPSGASRPSCRAPRAELPGLGGGGDLEKDGLLQAVFQGLRGLCSSQTPGPHEMEFLIIPPKSEKLSLNASSFLWAAPCFQQVGVPRPLQGTHIPGMSTVCRNERRGRRHSPWPSSCCLSYWKVNNVTINLLHN